jgi:glutathione S-transferase
MDKLSRQQPESVMTKPSITLYGIPLSGHCHRVEMLLRFLQLPFHYRETPPSELRSPAFLALNPLGQIPVLTDGDLLLADSNAILVYLARRYDASGAWLPDDPIIAARVQRWLSVAAGEVKFGPATARVICIFSVAGDLAAAQKIAARLLPFMDSHLAGRAFLADNAVTIADLACYSYVAHAPEGGIPLDPYPNIQAWLARVEALPGFVPMPRSALPAENRK